MKIPTILSVLLIGTASASASSSEATSASASASASASSVSSKSKTQDYNEAKYSSISKIFDRAHKTHSKEWVDQKDGEYHADKYYDIDGDDLYRPLVHEDFQDSKYFHDESIGGYITENYDWKSGSKHSRHRNNKHLRDQGRYYTNKRNWRDVTDKKWIDRDYIVDRSPSFKRNNVVIHEVNNGDLKGRDVIAKQEVVEPRVIHNHNYNIVNDEVINIHEGLPSRSTLTTSKGQKVEIQDVPNISTSSGTWGKNGIIRRVYA